jgi:hypothetical protein
MAGENMHYACIKLLSNKLVYDTLFLYRVSYTLVSQWITVEPPN